MSFPAPVSVSATRRPRVVIVGGGFGGLACASALGNADVDVTLIDRRNHNLFQPLLYQVATAILSPADISEPLRRTLGRYRNISVVLAEVCGVDTEAKAVLTREGAPVGYDVLVLAAGSVYNYFGHDDWPAVAPGLKTNREARSIRESLLLGFERAEGAANQSERRRHLTAVVVGGGPTGVEMAGAMAELGTFLIERDFRNLARDDFRIILVEASPGVLAGFDPDLAAYALERLGKSALRSGRRPPWTQSRKASSPLAANASRRPRSSGVRACGPRRSRNGSTSRPDRAAGWRSSRT